ncbi:CoA transferase [Saccharopolyspora mangrovi]|uniref:CoA transferase n=1 Tax=Saccharopolyspora mangrovi TaxID=3082379 RepID=UPI003899EEE8
MVRISGYGQTGPYRDRAGFGGVAEAFGGLRPVTGRAAGYRSGQRLRSRTPPVLHGMIGVLACGPCPPCVLCLAPESTLEAARFDAEGFRAGGLVHHGVWDLPFLSN